MILLTFTKRHDGQFDVNRWSKPSKEKLRRTHEAVTNYIPGWDHITMFRANPPDDMRVK